MENKFLELDRIYCGNVNSEKLNSEIKVIGWIKKIRKMGGMTFIDIADKSGTVQLVLNDAFTQKLNREYLIEALGKLIERKSVNKEIPTGNWEIAVNKLNIISEAEIPPMILDEKTDALEEVRLRNRYLDLRRPNLQKNLFKRAKLIKSFRAYLDENEFTEIDTPCLTKPTVEGANPYYVNYSKNKDLKYALAQSPQIYKQLLMVAGIERYYQIAHCFRNEDLRSDRQPEFMQLDIEVSFMNEEWIKQLCQKMLINSIKQVFNISITDQMFPRLTYKECLEKYGSDKPDLRYDLQIVNLTSVFKNLECFSKFKNVSAIVINQILTRKQIDEIRKSGEYLDFIIIENKKISSASIKKYIDENQFEKILLEMDRINSFKTIMENQTFILKAWNEIDQLNTLGKVRTELAKLLNLINNEDLKFLWVTEFPMFEKDSESQKISAVHHPFTAPVDENNFDINPLEAKARAYDLVLNGYEIAGGSVRVTDPLVQKRIFNIIGLNQKQIDDEFSFLLEAFKYGPPPHGGIAFGLDRFLMVLLKEQSIRDVIAFPKNSEGFDLMMNSPSFVGEK